MVSEEKATEENSSQPENNTTPSPGQMLRERREALGLSQQQVADKLFLKAHQINDLEEDRLDDNASITFTKGYVRNYAKQLGLDSAAVINAFEQRHVTAEPPAKLQSFSKRVAKQTHDDRWMMVTYLILLLIIGGVVAWWYQQPSDEGTAGNTPGNTVESTVDSTAERTVVERIKEEAGNTPVSSSNGRLGEPSSDEAGNGNARQDNARQAVDSVDNSINPEASSQGALNDSHSQLIEQATPANVSPDNGGVSGANIDESNNLTALVSNRADGTVALQQNTSPVPTSAPIQMAFTFEDDCWVNIKDATGEAIAYGVKQKGRVMEIQGVPPVEVTLGAPDNVRISINNEPVDISSYQNGTTARFTLPL